MDFVGIPDGRPPFIPIVSEVAAPSEGEYAGVSISNQGLQIMSMSAGTTSIPAGAPIPTAPRGRHMDSPVVDAVSFRKSLIAPPPAVIDATLYQGGIMLLGGFWQWAMENKEDENWIQYTFPTVKVYLDLPIKPSIWKFFAPSDVTLPGIE